MKGGYEVYRISKDFVFEAAHHLPSLPEGHKCRRVHGHSYVVRIVVESVALEPPGFVVDYNVLAPIGQFIEKHLDHHDLNEVMEPVEPTAEKIARWLYLLIKTNTLSAPLEQRVQECVTAVGVSETRKTWAWYEVRP